MNILSPSILAADFSRLGEQIREAEHAGAQYLHIDVMDGVFVPDISFGMPVILSIRKCSDIFFDVHLMIDRPERYIKEFADCGANLINFHIEATQDVVGTIQKIRFLGRKVGITISPETPAEAVEPYLKLVDMVLVMTVKPGFGGQKLMPECLDKVRQVRAMVAGLGLIMDEVFNGPSETARNRLTMSLLEASATKWVEGGIRAENVELALEAGANVIVSGSAVFGGSISDNVKRFLEKMT